MFCKLSATQIGSFKGVHCVLYTKDNALHKT